MLRLVYTHQSEASDPNAIPLGLRSSLEFLIEEAWLDYLKDGGDKTNLRAFWQYLTMIP